MKLSEALDELRTNLTRDTKTAYWTDITLVRYIVEAQRKFARETACLIDDITQEVTQVVLVADTPIYTLHEAVLNVRSARHEDATQDMVRIDHNIRFLGRINPYTD